MQLMPPETWKAQVAMECTASGEGADLTS